MPKGRIQSVYVPANKEKDIKKAKETASSKNVSFNKYILQSIKEKIERDNKRIFYNPPPRYIPKDV